MPCFKNTLLYITACCLFFSFYLLSVSCDEGSGSGSKQETPAVTVESSRNVNETDDFLRLAFLPRDVVPARLGRPSALRVFVGASVFFEPPVSLEETASFFCIPIGQNEKGLDLVAFRCIPGEPPALDANLATWPRVFALLIQDLGGQFTCPPDVSSPQNVLFCLAEGYTDTPGQIVSEGLANAINLGASIMLDPELAGALGNIYGISSSFSGLGLAVKGSGSDNLNAAQALTGSVVPEYLVKNATLTEGGCFCIRVPPYEGREEDLLDPDFIMKKGGFGECNIVDRLGFAN